LEAVVARQGSAFCLYFMDHCPKDWHDLAAHHDFTADQEMRLDLIDHGIYPFPLATKQWSISRAHTAEDIEATLECIEVALTARGCSPETLPQRV
jgi:glutamate-1-semialdehyde 2,1-aminomutase